VPPPQVDAFGFGIRVPTWVISPFAVGGVNGTLYDFGSVLKFIEHNFGLPTLASVNHRFDEGTPVGGDYQAAEPNATAGPPAPPRDGIDDTGDLMECLSF
jgi:phospholipase C